ncbi:tetratricopeptide repeat protein [bacterium]|nr:tetratricopeptide repeat protein [bacterium]
MINSKIGWKFVFCVLIIMSASGQLAHSDEMQPYEREVFSEVVKFVRKKEYSSAKKELLKIKKDDLSRYGQWKYYDNLGYCEKKLENYEDAIKNFKKCIELYYSNEWSYIQYVFYIYKNRRRSKRF